MSELPIARTELEIRAKRLMTGDGYRHWTQCRALGLCPACEQPLPLHGLRVRRGVHDSCHRLTYYHAAKCAWTIEDRIRDGKIDPGKPPHPLTEEARGEIGE